MEISLFCAAFLFLWRAMTVLCVTLSPSRGNIHHFLNEVQPTILQQLSSTDPKGTFCNYEFSRQTFGVISSPGYPAWYPSNITCRWKIMMKNNTRVVLTIREFFLGPGDQLTIDNGKSSDLYTLQKPPNNILFLSSSHVTVTLESSTFSSKSSKEKTRLLYALFEEEGCGGILTQESGYINVPLYIHGTKRPRECMWTVQAPKDKVITLDFMQFDMEPGSCVYNTLYVRDGDQNGGYVLGEFCEENPPFSKIRTVTNTLSIAYRVRPHLIADELLVLPFIKMFYRVVDSCGGTLEGYSGSFWSPNRWMDDRFSCVWSITVPESKVIELRINDLRLRHPKNMLEELQVVNNEQKNVTSVLWRSNGHVSPPESIIIPNNKGVVRLIANRNRTAKPALHFKAFYEAVVPVSEDCFQISDRKFFMCRDESYIDCSKRCDGVLDCDAGNDERNCPTKGIKRTLDFVHKEEVQDLQMNKQKGWISYVVLWTIAIAISASVVGLLILGDQIMRKFNAKPFTVHPPPYQKYEGAPSRCTAPVEVSSSIPPPPPYESSEATTQSEMMSRTCSVPFNLDSVTNESSESINRQRHSTPYSLFSSNSTLMGSSESIPRGQFFYLGSTDGSTESISRSTNHRNIPVTALFHDTDVIESTTSNLSLLSNTSVQIFRFSESQTDHEDFIREIQQFKEPDIF